MSTFLLAALLLSSSFACHSAPAAVEEEDGAQAITALTPAEAATRADTVTTADLSPSVTGTSQPKTQNAEEARVSSVGKPATAPSRTPVRPTTPAPPAAASSTDPLLPAESKDIPDAAEAVAQTHAAWDALLRAHVTTSGQVDYRALQGKIPQLDAYLAELAKQVPDASWTAAAVKAYWINAYNAFTVRLILAHYPVSSIRDIDGGNPWDKKWIKLGGQTYSLNQIEHEILRPRFQDARIHFALNCAAVSCPPLYNRAFRADNVEAQLQRLTRAFIRNEQYNQITAEEVRVSRLFDWYQADFGDVRNYLNTYLEVPIAAQTPIEFREYDWSLNGN